MKLLLLFLLISISGCSSTSWDNARQRTFGVKTSETLAAERAERLAEKKEQEEKDRIENEKNEKIDSFKKAMKPGMKMSEIVAVFGPPDRTEFTPHKIGHWYDDTDQPIFLIYNTNEILESKVTDVETIRFRAATAEMIQEIKMKRKEAEELKRQREDQERTQNLMMFATLLNAVNTNNQLQNIQKSQNRQSHQIQQIQNQNNPYRINQPNR